MQLGCLVADLCVRTTALRLLWKSEIVLPADRLAAFGCFLFVHLSVVRACYYAQEPRLVGLLRRETAAEALMTTVNDQRLKADVAPLEAAAVEAILPVSGRDARMRLRRPASTLKETVCVVRYRLDSQLFDSVLVKVSVCTPLVAYTPPQVCLPAMLRDAEADAVDSGKAVGMDAGIGAF